MIAYAYSGDPYQKLVYNALSNLTSLTDSFGNRTEYAYDPLGRLSKVTYPDGSTLEYSYDSAGNLLREKQRSGTVVTNTYDNGNRLISRTITKAPGVEGTSTESYIYDGLSRLTKGTNDVSVVERRYDSLSRLIEEIQDGKSVQYGYDRVGNSTSIRYPNSRLVEREFDLLNRVSRIKQGSDVISTMEFLGRSYRLASKGYQNGDLVKYLYDQGRRLVNSETKNKNNAILQSFGWGYDSLDLKSFEKRIHNGGKGDAFSYDALKRLTNVTFDSPTPETPTVTGTKSRAITLDKLDNILKITDNENAMVTEIIGELEGKGKALNQYSKFNDLPLEYDKSGNLSAKGSRLFAYDYRNRLVRSSKGDDAVTFTYDIFGRQTSRTDLSGTLHFFYAGDQKIEERNASGQVTKQYFWGNGIDELLRLDIYNGSSSTPYYVHTDNIGSTTAITDGNGNLVERVTYDSYGVPTFTDALGQTLKKSTIRNTTLFQGREYDYDLSLYNYRARYLDPSLGRFLQTDPLGYQDSMNLYQGMNMNPVNFVDPRGLEIIKAELNPETDIFNTQSAKTGIKLLDNTLVGAYNEMRNAAALILNTVANILYHTNNVHQGVKDITVNTTAKVTGLERWDVERVVTFAEIFYMTNQAQIHSAISQLTGFMKPAISNIGTQTVKTSNVLAKYDSSFAAQQMGISVKKFSNLPPLRQSYITEVISLKREAESLKKGGMSLEEVARKLHALRREIGFKYKGLTPASKLDVIYERNLNKYGDKLGPSIEYLRSKGNSWEDIIESAYRPGGEDLGY